jgi:glycosyltransferase involved in cell wall biosynthesis
VSGVALAHGLRPADPSSDAAAGGRDVIFAFAYATWRTAVERGMCFSEDRLAQQLMRDPSVRRLLLVETPRSLPIKLVKDAVRRPPRFPADERRSLYGPARLRRSDPTGVRALERTYAAWGRRLERAARRHGLERPALITTHPLVPGFAALDWIDSLTFYIYDDWASSPPLRRWWPAYEESYRRVRERGHRVVAVSQAIVDKVRPAGPHAVVPNGVDPDEWLFPGRPPAWFAALPAPRLLYVGSLDARIDVEQLSRTARAFREGSITVAGPMLEPRHFDALAREPNVGVRGPVNRRELVALVAAADACLLPHVRNSLTEAMSPLKLYEYLAGGAPVAALDLPPIRGVDPHVVIDAELADAVRRALALGRAGTAERRRFAEAHSWSARQRRIVELALTGAGAETG